MMRRVTTLTRCRRTISRLLLASCVSAPAVLLAALPARAQEMDMETDARLEGFNAQVNGEQIVNATFSTTTGTPSSGLALIEINRPFHQGQIV